MNMNKNLILSIVAVGLIIALVGGGTYAYWQWTSANNTVVSFTVTGGTMNIDGGGNITTKTLAPSTCINATYAIRRKIKVTATNQTTTAMKASVGLNVAALTAGHGSFDSTTDEREKIYYALVTTDATQYAASGFSITAAGTNGNACSTNATASGNFGGKAANSSIALLSNLSVPAASGGTDGSFTGYYELYIWIDKAYTGKTTSGTTVTDPLQDLTLNLTWTGSMTNQ